MLVRIENFLTKQEVTDAVSLLEKADWVDGAVTAGHLALHAKKNLQLPEDSPTARQLGDFILSLMGQSQHILAAGLPNKIYPPCSTAIRVKESLAIISTIPLGEWQEPLLRFVQISQ